MSGVDVLEVMQRASLRIADLSGGYKTATEAELQEARSYVAKLIEEVEKSLDAHYDATGTRDGYYGYITDGLEPALRRVKGE